MIHGYVKGFVEEFFSWAALVISIIAAVFLHPAGAAFIREKAMKDVRFVPEILAFVAIFIIVMLFFKMLERVLKDVIMGAKLGGINKLLGLIFGLLEGFALTALVLFVMSVQPVFDVSKILGDSIFAQILLPHFSKIPLEKGKEIITTTLIFTPETDFAIFRA
jgi:membrane protein required for colicin V production